MATRFCQRCRTPIIRRYLWAIHLKSGSSQEQESTLQESWRGELASTVDPFMAEADLGDRYLAFGDRVFLDTQPATKPQTVENLPPEIVNYLQLFDCYPHVPRVYGQLDNTDLWLLEYGTVPVNSSGEPIHPELLPRLDSLWKETSPCKQLTWLIQLAYLWQPLEQKSLTATAIAPELIRINGSLVQFIELRQNQDTAPTLIDLGKLWQQWAQQAQPEIQEVLIELSQRMASGALAKISEVISVLDRALELCSQSQEYSSEIYSISESGPRRKNNQDRAYPDSLMPTKVAGESHSLAIVCDGVGGHEGGEIASQHTVKILSDRLSNFTWQQLDTTPAQIADKLVAVTNEVNDGINERNDREQRQERQRMGTTLVMTLARKYELFLNHIGDSRIYLITPSSCHQITTDDDLASRETRLGYAVYRDALQYPSAGALIQALGMRHSDTLHPNIKRLTVDGEYILLLCTDGLSDFDRVEQYWYDALLPVFKGKWDLATAVQALIKIGNERNGHDNVTAALVHFQVQPKPNSIKISWKDVEQCLDESTIIWANSFSKDSFSEGDSLVNVPTASQDRSDTQIAIPPTIRASESKKPPIVAMAIGIVSVFLASAGILLYAYNRDNNSLPNQSPDVMELEELERQAE